jgi:hypothetical protein
MKFKFFSDPGHGWLEVPFALLKVIGIADKITSYSYRSRDGSMAYLEEDCDYGVFHERMHELEWKFSFEEVNAPHGDSHVRRMPSYFNV